MNIDLNTVWNNCTLVYNPASPDKSSPEELLLRGSYAWASFLQKIRMNNGVISNNVWYDAVKDVCFGADLTWLNENPHKSSFICSRESFLDSDRYGKNCFTRPSGREPANLPPSHWLYRDIITDIKRPSENSVSRVLVIGAGPSTKENIDKINFEEYDKIISCNHFFISDILGENKNKVDYAILGREVDLSRNNKDLHNFLKNSDTKIVFETVNDGSMERDIATQSEFVKEYASRVNYVNFRYRSKLGSAPRLVILASYLQPSSIDIVGMDGKSENTKLGDLHNHAFQKNKRYNQATAGYHLCKRQYVEFWDYVANVLSAGGKIKFNNLGEGHEMNQSSEITKTGIFK